MLVIMGSVVTVAAAAIFFLLGVFSKKRRKELVTTGVYFLLLTVGIWVGFWGLLALIQWSNTYEPADVAGTYQLESDASDPAENDQIILRSDGTFSSTSASALGEDCLRNTFYVELFPDYNQALRFQCSSHQSADFEIDNHSYRIVFRRWSNQPEIVYERVDKP